MPTPIDQAKEYVASLNARGVRATHNPAKIAPPCIIIAPPTVTLDTNCGGTGEWKAYALAAGGVGNSDAWAQLDSLALAAFDVLPVESVQPAEYKVDEANSYPAFELAWAETTEWRA